MNKRICACLLAAVMTATFSISSFAAPIDMRPRMSLSSTVQEKKGIKSKSLTAKQLEELKKEESSLFDYPEVSTSHIDKKKMLLELDVVGQASAGLKKKLKGIENKYGVDSKITIVEEYEWVDLPQAEETTQVQQGMNLSSVAQNSKKKTLSEKQIIQLWDEEDKLFDDYKELSTSYLNKKNNSLELEVVKKASSGLQKKLKELEKEYGIQTKITIVENYEEFEEPNVDGTKKEYTQTSKQPPKEKTAKDYAWDFANYLSDQLTGNEYSYVTVRESDSVMEIGVPSVKTMEKAIDVVETYREAKGIKYMDYLQPEKYVMVEYRLCQFSRSQIIRAYNWAVQDEEYQKFRTDGSIYWVDYHGDRVRMGYVKNEKALKKWRENSNYSELISLEPFYKVNPE